MDVLPPYIELIESTGRQCNPRKRFERVKVTDWSETAWDTIIVENVDLLAACLKEARVIDEDTKLRVLGTQIDNIDVVLAVVSDTDQQELRRLVLLEDKLLRNPEAKRQVLAQILDYAHVVQEDWPTANLVDKLSGNGQWVIENLAELKRGSRRADFLLVVTGDGIDDGMERLARRFAGQDDPLSLSELALVSMALYKHDFQYLLVPHVVSAVQRSERELTVQVVVQDVAGREVAADVTVVPPLKADAGVHAPLPVRDEVVTFLRNLRDRVEGVFPGVAATAKPRKSIEFWQTAADDASVVCKVHFGGYQRDIWSPIQVGVMAVAKDTAGRDRWAKRFEEQLDRLPPGTSIRPGGPRTIDVLKTVEWTSSTDLNDSLAESLAKDFVQFADVVKSLLSSTSGELR